jgi:hypothetical protein
MPWIVPPEVETVVTPEARAKAAEEKAVEMEDILFHFLDKVRDTLLDDLEDVVEDQIDRLQKLTDVSKRDIRAAVKRGLDRALKPSGYKLMHTTVEQDAEGHAVVWRDSNGKLWATAKRAAEIREAARRKQTPRKRKAQTGTTSSPGSGSPFSRFLSK